MKQLLAQLLTLLATIAAIATAGACAMWSVRALGTWREIPYDAIQNSMYRFLLIAGLTGFVYRGARIYVGVSMERPNALERSKCWRIWAYVRWTLASAMLALFFSAWTPGGAGFFRNDVSERVQIHSAVEFLKAYSALLIVGLLGTCAGVKEAALKREMKQ
jgi:hypothetical protein